MTARQSTPSSEHSAHSDSNVRKRVCKACDRCRLKKSKCDGSSPCGRCRTDNAICVFGERKKAHDKVYPKGYVEMLEQQQVWLVNGLQELYRRAQEGEGWAGEPLKVESNGQPLTHDLLTGLGALDHSKGEQFEENVDAMQQKLWQQNAGLMQRQESSDGSSDIAHSPPLLPQALSQPQLTSSNLNAHSSSSNNHHHHRHHHNNNRRHHPYSISQFTDAMSRHQLPPTPPSYSPSSSAPAMPALPIIKSEQGLIPTSTSTISVTSSAANNYSTLLSQQQQQQQPQPQHGINPMALQQQQNQQQQPHTPWANPGNDLGFDDIDLIGNQFPLYDDSSNPSNPSTTTATTTAPMFIRQQHQQQQQMPINCLPPSMLFDATNDEFNQYFNTITEISTI